jgi:tRNA(fMet)-specific endonuclease VapC
VSFLIDTSVCVGAIRRLPDFERRLRGYDPSELAVSVVTVLELLFGAGISQAPELNRQQVEEFLGGMLILDIKRDIADRAAATRVLMRRSGLGVSDFDLLIAATAMVHERTLMTSDRNFLRIPGLTVEDWTR